MKIIITSDWHIRETAPSCREEQEFLQAQWAKIDYISDLQKKYDCPVIHAGDLFHHWKPSPYLLSKTMEHLPKKFYTIYGNHDLPQHNIELANKCGVYLLEKAGKLNILPGVHWLQEYKEGMELTISKRILPMHIMTYQGSKLYPGMTDTPARGILRNKKYKDIDLIITGHNHQTFVEEWEGKLLINPGSITRQSIDDEKEPCIYLYDTDDGSYEKIILPHEKEVLQLTYNNQKLDERNERIDAFIEKLNGEGLNDVDFDRNLESFLAENKTEKEIREIIYQSIDTENIK